MLTFGEYRDAAERAAAGFAERGVSGRRRRVLAAAHVDRVAGPRRRAVPPRRGAEPDPADLPRARGRLRHPAGRRQAAASCPACGAASTTRRWPSAIAAENGGRGGRSSSRPARCPRATRRRSRRPPTPAADEPPVRWLFYTSGTTADPKGARHTDATIMADGTRHGRAPRLRAPTTERARVPVHPHRRHHLAVLGLLTGGGNILIEAFDPQRDARGASAARASRIAGLGHAVPHGLPRRAAGQARTRAVPEPADCPGGGAPKPPQLHYDVKDELGGAGHPVGLRAHRGARSSRCRPRRRRRRGARRSPRARRCRASSSSVVTLDGHGRAASARRARCGPRRRSSCWATSTSRSTPTRSTTTATSAPATSACSTPTATSCITGRLKDIIIRKGENISAKEVEDLLYTHPKVADVAVIGLPDPNDGRAGVRRRGRRRSGDRSRFVEMRDFLKDEGPARPRPSPSSSSSSTPCPATRPARSSSTSSARSTRG